MREPSRNRQTSCSTDNKIFGKVAVPPATSRHPNHSLPLLPSGPGGVCKLSSRENRRDHRRKRSHASGIHSAHPVPRPAGGFAVQIGSCRFVEPIIFHFAGSNSHPSCYKIWRRERDSNPRSGITRLHTFQACSFNHSDTSPYTYNLFHFAATGIVRPFFRVFAQCRSKGAQNTGGCSAKQADISLATVAAPWI